MSRVVKISCARHSLGTKLHLTSVLSALLQSFLCPALKMAFEVPANVHISRHPCLRAKLSQLRSKSTNARETKTLVHDLAFLLGTEALAELEIEPSGTVSLSSLAGGRRSADQLQADHAPL